MIKKKSMNVASYFSAATISTKKNAILLLTQTNSFLSETLQKKMNFIRRFIKEDIFLST